MKRLFSFLVAILALLSATLACGAENNEPGVSKIRMVTDDTGETTTTEYTPTDPFIVFFEVNQIEPDTTFEARWYALEIEGEDPDTPFKTSEYLYEEGNQKIYFQLSRDSEWSVGTYRVEIYMNDEKAGEVQFEVK